MNFILPFLYFSQMFSFYTNAPYIYDDYGRIRIFHGINRINKNIDNNYYFEDMLTSNESDKLSQLGFNVVRLGWMWNGFQRNQEIFNYSYFNVMNTIVNQLGKNGIYTILDMHQDVLSSLFCTYDGVPLWLIQKSIPKFKFPWPLKYDNCSRNWQLNQLTEASSQAYEDLYKNKSGMLDDFIHFWNKSLYLWNSNPYILGYELINEPFPGNFFRDPLILLPSEAGKQNLQPFYDKVRQSLINTSKLIFYEPITWGMIFNNKIFDSGLSHVPGGNVYKNTSVYSYHYYCTAFLSNGPQNPILEHTICDNFLAPVMFNNVVKHVNKVGGSSFMTEFGDCDLNNYTKLSECDTVLNFADTYFQSWTDYSYAQTDIFNPSRNWTRTYSRTYPQAISGLPINMSYNRNTFEFKFCFKSNTNIKKPTEVYFTQFNNINLTEGLNYTIQDHTLFIYSKKNNTYCLHLY